MMTRDDLRAALAQPNVQAFLQVIRAGEGTLGPDGYRRMFTGPLFDSYAQHPNQVHKAGALASTAAGAYQFLHRTWAALLDEYHFPDFSPQCQDEGAVALIAGRRALEAVIAGRLGEAIGLCNKEWASLPGSPYGQPTRNMAQATRTYTQAGGTLATTAAAPATTPTKEAQPMAPLLLPLAGALIEIFTPLAREKLTKEMSRHTDKPEVADQIATGVIEAAKVLTGQADPIAAVAAVKAGGPDLVASVEADAIAQLDRLLGFMERAQIADDKSRDKALDRNLTLAKETGGRWLYLLGGIATLVVVASYAITGLVMFGGASTISDETKALLLGQIVIFGFVTVLGFLFGSNIQNRITDARKQDG